MLLKDVALNLTGTPNNYYGYRLAIGDGANDIILDLNNHTLSFTTTSDYGGYYLMAYDCTNFVIQNGTLRSYLGYNMPLFYSWSGPSPVMNNVTLINIDNNK